MAKMLKTGTGSWFFNRKCQKSLFPFPVFNFQGFTLLFWQKVGRIWPFLANFLGISTGSSSISAGSGPKSADFSKFSRLHALCGKKLRNFATGNGNGVQKCLKTLIFEKNACFFTKSLKFTRFFTHKPEIQGFYCVFMWQYFQISSKISQNFIFRSKNLENLRGFCPPNRKWRLLLHFYVTIFGHFKGKRPKKFFRRLCKGKIQVF